MVVINTNMPKAKPICAEIQQFIIRHSAGGYSTVECVRVDILPNMFTDQQHLQKQDKQIYSNTT